jgi:predicted transcriptional regulator
MPTSVKLDDDLKSRIQHLADIRHRSAHWIMREAIRESLWRPGQLIRKPGGT